MVSAFIVHVQPQLQSDPSEETAALLRVLIYKIDNTTFGDDVPVVPQWSGPPRRIIQVQVILYASLAASIFSAFLAMLGKQWLNRYASIDMRGSGIERSQNRQQKLDGIVTWYFDYVMESLPLMLQFSLLLLGCALCRHLWELDTTVASVVLGVISFGVISYAFFIIAGTASPGCPYQTPGSWILRRIPRIALHALDLISSHSKVIKFFHTMWRGFKQHKHSTGHVASLLLSILLSPMILLAYLANDAFLLTRVVVTVLISNAKRVHGWLHKMRRWDPQTPTFDLQCILWMLRTSFDRAVHLSALELLGSMTSLAGSNPEIVSACFDTLVSCVSMVGGKAVIRQGSERMTEISALCCLRTFSHLMTVDPTSRTFEDIRRRYIKNFPIETDFNGFPSYHRFRMIHNTFHPSRKRVYHPTFYFQDTHRPKVQWRDYKLSSIECNALIQLARCIYQRRQYRKAPRWILRFAHHLLSQDPLPPTSVVADWLSIIAMDLGCTVSNVTTLDERYVHILQIPALLTENQCTAGGGFQPDN